MGKFNLLFLRNLSILSPLLPILVFCFFRFNWKQKLKWVIFVLLVIGVIVDTTCENLAHKSIPTIWFINLYTLLEGLFVLLFFFLLFKIKRNLKLAAIGCSLIFLTLWLGRNILLGKIHNYDYLSQGVEFIFFFFFCLAYFFQKATVSNTEFIYSTYEFWIVSALLIYSAGTFFSFFIPIDTHETKIDTDAFEYISRIGNIFKNILITIAFFVNNKPSSNNIKNRNSIYYMNDLKD